MVVDKDEGLAKVYFLYIYSIYICILVLGWHIALHSVWYLVPSEATR